MFNSRHCARTIVLTLLLSVALFSLMPAAFGQADFTMLSTAFKPFAVEPGGSATSTLTLSPVNGFNGSVAFQCVVTPVQAISPPACAVSPASVFPPASPTVTVTTTTATPPTLYTVTVTGTGPSTSHEVNLNLTVLAVTAEYTITVTTTVSPTTVHAGSGSTAVLTVTPLNGYSGNVTLSCSAISPTATPAPSCAFTPNPVVITGAAQTSTLTISTVGPQTAMAHPRILYGLLPLSGSALFAVVLGGGKSRSKWFSLGILCVLVVGLALMPACNGSNGTNGGTGDSGKTPNNTYSFTLNGVDDNSLAPSNGTQTVSLTVN